MTKSIVEQFAPLAAELDALTKQAILLYAPLAESIIAGRITDKAEIEHILDQLISFGYSDEITQLFKRVCRKIYDAHPDVVHSYVYAYLDMWSEEHGGDEG
ncbi:hypothetical protein FACS189419_07930 [Planctomycetales bacterium]|nr:hypothetical protein FACS189419_07930 [Planctomycetales bacterium]